MLELVERPYPEWPLASLFGLLIGGEAKDRPADLRALRDVPVLAETWKVTPRQAGGAIWCG